MGYLVGILCCSLLRYCRGPVGELMVPPHALHRSRRLLCSQIAEPGQIINVLKTALAHVAAIRAAIARHGRTSLQLYHGRHAVSAEHSRPTVLAGYSRPRGRLRGTHCTGPCGVTVGVL